MSTGTELDQESAIEKSLAHWLCDFADFGILVTNVDLAIVYTNKWFAKNVGAEVNTDPPQNLFEAFPELRQRGFDRYYDDALSGQTRILSHRFHEYLFAMEPTIGEIGSAYMQQSARISPLLLDEQVIGTISIIEDVSDRVRRETELNFQIEERSRLLEKEISARELAEENERLRDTSYALKIEGAQLIELARERDTLMHRIIAGQEEERKRIARNVHDHLGQQLTALRFALSLIRQRVVDKGEAAESITKAQLIAENLDKEVDYLAWELRPAEIDDIGLEEALKTLIREWTRHYGIEAKFHGVGMAGTRLPQDTEINLYRIAQEALTNISKYAKADRVVVFLEKRENNVVLIIEDNGVGFDLAAKQQLSPLNRGLGIFGMYERAGLVSGTIEIDSKPSIGTSIFVRVPFPDSEASRVSNTADNA